LDARAAQPKPTRRDLGDFQTPPALAAQVVKLLGPIGSRWSRVLEPTCGQGAFLSAILADPSPPHELIGVEIQDAYCDEARQVATGTSSTRCEVVRANLFDLDLRSHLSWQTDGPLLVVGNPPWVTSAELGRLSSGNSPARRNVKGLAGLAARTGEANFDLAEAVWLKLIDELADQEPTIALLCKTATARAVLEFMDRQNRPIHDAALHEINAGRWFGAAVGACLLRVTIGKVAKRLGVSVFTGLEDSSQAIRTLSFHDGKLIADADAFAAHRHAYGACPLTWRQGLKHDLALCMELIQETDNAGAARDRNGLGEIVEVEPDFIYPLVKGADLRKPPAERPRRAVIVTQERIGQETASLQDRAPRLWSYLQAHATRFAARKSSIYRGQPAFAIFGVGPYSFSPWKVAISGLHRPPLFRVIGPRDGRPVFFDDTCYLLPCETAPEAAVLASLCNSDDSLGLLRALSFPDAKRAVTIGLLKRIDLSAILKRSNRAELAARASAALEELADETRWNRAEVEAEIERLDDRFHNQSGERSSRGST
jgi:hypothetical protein